MSDERGDDEKKFLVGILTHRDGTEQILLIEYTYIENILVAVCSLCCLQSNKMETHHYRF